MKRILDFIKEHKQFTFFLFLSIMIIFVAVMAPYITTKDPFAATMADSLKRPGKEYLLGADKMGRDVFSRIIYGTRESIKITALILLITFVSGTLLGITSAYFGGIIDKVIMRITDIMLSFPSMVLAIAIAGILGTSSINAVLAISIVGWTKYARISRSLALKVKESLYIKAARCNGTTNWNILKRHILPNILPTMIVTLCMDVGTVIIEFSSLSFLGFGAKSPAAEWGLMLSEGRMYFDKAPWLMLWPGLAIIFVVVVFNMLGDSLRDVLD